MEADVLHRSSSFLQHSVHLAFGGSKNLQVVDIITIIITITGLGHPCIQRNTLYIYISKIYGKNSDKLRGTLESK